MTNIVECWLIKKLQAKKKKKGCGRDENVEMGMWKFRKERIEEHLGKHQ